MTLSPLPVIIKLSHYLRIFNCLSHYRKTLLSETSQVPTGGKTCHDDGIPCPLRLPPNPCGFPGGKTCHDDRIPRQGRVVPGGTESQARSQARSQAVRGPGTVAEGKSSGEYGLTVLPRSSSGESPLSFADLGRGDPDPRPSLRATAPFTPQHEEVGRPSSHPSFIDVRPCLRS